MALRTVRKCRACGSIVPAGHSNCSACGASVSLFAGRKAGFDWREIGLPVTTILWTLVMTGSAIVVPGAYGFVFVIGAVLVALAIFAQWDWAFTAVKYLCVLGVIRGFRLLTAAQVDNSQFWIVVGATLMALSSLLAYLVHWADE